MGESDCSISTCINRSGPWKLRRPDGKEWTSEERFEMIAEAGYKGVSLDPMVDDIDHYREYGPLIEKYQLGCVMNVFPLQH